MKALPSWLMTLAAGLFMLGAGQAVHADPITFSTTGVFSGIPVDSGCTGNGTNEIRCGDGRRLTYVANSLSRDRSQLPFNDNPLGTFLFVNLPPSSAVGPIFPAGIGFTLFVNQIDPLPASGSFFGTIIVESTSVASYNTLLFGNTELNLGGIDYRLLGFTFPSANMPSQVSAVPEPATLLLLGTGLAGVAGAARRRRRARRSEPDPRKASPSSAP